MSPRPYISIAENVDITAISLDDGTVSEDKLRPIRIALDLVFKHAIDEGYVPAVGQILSAQLRIYLHHRSNEILWDAYRGLTDNEVRPGRSRIWDRLTNGAAEAIQTIDQEYFSDQLKERRTVLIMTGWLKGGSNHKLLQLHAMSPVIVDRLLKA